MKTEQLYGPLKLQGLSKKRATGVKCWFEFVVGSRPCSMGCSPGPPVFPSSTIFYISIRPGNRGQEEPPHGMSTAN